MDFNQLVNELIIDSKGSAAGGVTAGWEPFSSVAVFVPEILLCVTMVVMLLFRLCRRGQLIPPSLIAFAGTLLAFFVSLRQGTVAHEESIEIFTGMLVYDPFSVMIRSILLGFTSLFVLFTCISGIPDREDGADIYTLVLGAALGMCLMASANHLLMIFLAIEMASVPSYALAGLLKGRRESSEAALKYAVYGAGAAGVMLYGISLVAGLTSTAHLPSIATQLSQISLEQGNGLVLGLGGLFIAVGLAFKLSAVPFHFWCPDVFEGASAEVAGFLSVASKAAALALLVRVAIGFGVAHSDLERTTPNDEAQPQVAVAAVGLVAAEPDPVPVARTYVTAFHPGGGEDGEHIHEPAEGAAGGEPELSEARAGNLATVREFIGKLIAFLAIITCTFGNLAAYGQTNIKRLLAYSTIAHAGYMMMAVSPMIALVGIDNDMAERAAAGLGVYIFVYVFMNLGAFAVVAFLRNAMRTEEIADYSGLIRHCPVVVICFALMLFSLVGLPPLAGFIGKFAIFASLANGYVLAEQPYLLVLLVAGGINTAISLFYYLRVIKVMTIDPAPESRAGSNVPFLPTAFIFLLTLPTIILIFEWDWLNAGTIYAAEHLLP